MKFKRFLSVFMCIAIVFAALPVAAYAQDEAPIAETEEQITKTVDLDTLKEKVEDAFSMGSFWAIGAYISGLPVCLVLWHYL